MSSSQEKIQKRAGGVAQGVSPEFKSQYCKKKKKNPTQKRTGRVAQVVEHLASKREALRSNRLATKKKSTSYQHPEG
jgi:hypothetical protein